MKISNGETAKIFQVSTLQALALGYSRAVITVSELMKHGCIGLGTFEDVNGEMIVLDGKCFRADEKGHVTEADPETGVGPRRQECPQDKLSNTLSFSLLPKSPRILFCYRSCSFSDPVRFR